MAVPPQKASHGIMDSLLMSVRFRCANLIPDSLAALSCLSLDMMTFTRTFNAR